MTSQPAEGDDHMSKYHRSRLLKWIGTGTLLSAGLSWAAQQPPAPPQPTPPAPQPPSGQAPTPTPNPSTPPKDPAPTMITPTTNVEPAKLADKQVAFEMRDKPWKSVLEWLCNETGLPVITVATPTGSFSFYGNPKKKYSIPEIIDIINEALLSQKYVMIRREASLTVVPADMQIDPSIIPTVGIDDLKHRGATEIVRVHVSLTTMNAEDVAPEILKMMGPFKEVTALSRSNQLVLQDTAKSLRQVVDTIKQMENSERTQTDSYSHECKYIPARDAERILKELLGNPAEIMRQMTQAAQPQQPGQPNQPQPKAAPPVKIKMYYVSVDDRLNTVLVSGPPDKIAQAKEIMKRIDTAQAGQQIFKPGPQVLKSYNTAAGAAENVAKTLQQIYANNTSVRISAVGPNAVMVFAQPDDHFKIATLIQGADLKQSETALMPVTVLDAEKTATTLKGMFQDAKTGVGPYIEADTTRGAIIVKGSPDQVADVKAALKAIGEDGTGGGNVRVISLERGNASAIAAELERLLSQMRKNPVRVIAPSGEAKPKEEPKSPPPSPGGNGGGQDSPQLQDPRVPKPGSEKPVTITALGGRIVISSEDPQALALAQELVRMLTKDSGPEGAFEIIKLKNAIASDAARVIDEAFNGARTSGPQQQQSFGFPFGGPFGGRFGGQSAPASSSSSTSKVRVIADPSSNSLLIKASPVDMIEIRRLIKDSIDSSNESRALSKTYVIGPLKYAKAQDVYDTIRDIYRDSMSSNTTQQVGRGGGGGFNPFGGMPIQRLTDANGNPRPASLTVSVNEATNTLVVHCSEALYKDIDTLAKQLELVSQGSPRSIRVVSIKGIDPQLLTQALEALHGPSNNNSRGGGMFFSPFGGGFNTMGGGGNSRGGRGGRGGRNSNFRAPDREPPGGPDFFEAGVKEDRQPAMKDVANVSETQLFDPSIALVSGEEEQQPPPGPSGGRPQLPGQESQDIRSPRAPVNFEALEQLQAIIISAENQADLEDVLRVIKYLQDEAAKSEVELRIVPLKQADATHLVSLLNQIYSRIIVGPNGNSSLPLSEVREQQPRVFRDSFFGTSTSQTTPASSLLLLPLPRQNAILLGAPKTRMADVIKEIERLDIPTAPGAKPVYFPLKNASASSVADQVTRFYSTRYPNETDANNQIRVTADNRSNTVIVQAAPADLAEIRDLIQRIDGSVSSAVNDLRIIRLNNALADELANTLIQAIKQGIAPAAAAPAQPQRQNPFLFGAQQTAAQAAPAAQAASAGTSITKATTLRFLGTAGPGGVVESGLLDDVHINSEARSNSLIISAPPKTMELLGALIRSLDVPPAAQAGLKVFTLKKADAQQTATLLQQMLGGAAAQPRTQIPGANIPGVQQPAAAPGTTRPLLTLSGQAPEGATLIDLKISVDDRTNSIIAAGSPNDLEVIETLVSRLDDADVQSRRNEVYKLRNAAAADVYTALQQFLTNSLGVLNNANQLTAYQVIQKEVVIVPEPISNTLLISATPRYYDEVIRLIAQIDSLPPQVVIQVLIADVALSTTEEFGVEIGLQSPILFQRSIIPGASSFSGQVTGLPLPTGVTVNSTLPGAANPGFNFNQPRIFPQNNFTAGPGIVGYQGLGSLNVGRVSPTSGIGGLVFSAASDTFSLLIRALKLQGRIDILSRPQVMTLDNQTAAVNIGQNVPILAGTVVSGTGVSQQNIDRVDVGVNLFVTPRITPDGRVLLRLAPEVSNLGDLIPLGNGQSGQVINQQKLETTVATNDGETVVIGGLITTLDNKQENKIPWLGDLPYVGAAFRYRTQNRQKRELLVIMTPHIVRTPEEAQRILMMEARRMDWILGDVCKVHGPGGLESILPYRPNCGDAPNGLCVPGGEAPDVHGGVEPSPNQLPNIIVPPAPGVPQPMVPPSSQANPPAPSARPATLPAASRTIQPAVSLQPAGQLPNRTNPNPPINNSGTGKESKPWVFRND